MENTIEAPQNVIIIPPIDASESSILVSVLTSGARNLDYNEMAVLWPPVSQLPVFTADEVDSILATENQSQVQGWSLSNGSPSLSFLKKKTLSLIFIFVARVRGIETLLLTSARVEYQYSTLAFTDELTGNSNYHLY